MTNDTLPPSSSTSSSSPQPKQVTIRVGKSGKVIIGIAVGCLLLSGLGTALSVVAGMYGFSKLMGPEVMDYFKGTPREQTDVPPGNLKAFDPIATFGDVKAYAGPDTYFAKMTATLVQSNGTMNLTADLTPRPTVSYEFIEERTLDEETAPPIGAGVGESGKQWKEVDVVIGNPDSTVQVNRIGGGVNMRYSYKNKGMIRQVGSTYATNPAVALPDPVCPFEILWKHALSKGAPQSAVATITYDKDGYAFTIRDTSYRYQFDMGCQPVGR